MRATSIASGGLSSHPRPTSGIPLAAVLGALLLGCTSGTNPASVDGVVTLDGKPLQGATVLFRPSVGRPSAGKTDANGRYRLRYTSERDGAVAGEHTVSISMLGDDGGGEDEASDASKPRSESIPARYNTQTELRATVSGSGTTADFDLKSR